MRSSSAITICASSMSWCSSASSVRSSVETTRSSPPSAWRSSVSSSSWNCVRPWKWLTRSAELAGHVALGALVVGVGEDVLGRAALDELALEQEGGLVGDARGLLRVVGDDDDRYAR